MFSFSTQVLPFQLLSDFAKTLLWPPLSLFSFFNQQPSLFTFFPFHNGFHVLSYQLLSYLFLCSIFFPLTCLEKKRKKQKTKLNPQWIYMPSSLSPNQATGEKPHSPPTSSEDRIYLQIISSYLIRALSATGKISALPWLSFLPFIAEDCLWPSLFTTTVLLPYASVYSRWFLLILRENMISQFLD